MPQYQIRLKAGQTLAQVRGELSMALAAALKGRPGFEDVGAEDERLIRRELEGVLSAFVSSGAYCGTQAICEENLEPAPWNTRPDPALAARHPWESAEIQRYPLVVRRDFAEFSDAILAGVLRAAARGAKRAERAREVKKALEAAVAGTLGPHLFQNTACGQCELCRDSRQRAPNA